MSAKETKCTSLEVRTHPTFLENSISKHDFGPVKLPGVSRNRPLISDLQYLSSLNVSPSKMASLADVTDQLGPFALNRSGIVLEF